MCYVLGNTTDDMEPSSRSMAVGCDITDKKILNCENASLVCHIKATISRTSMSISVQTIIFYHSIIIHSLRANLNVMYFKVNYFINYNLMYSLI